MLVAANAVLGGISVRVDLHPIAIQGHLLLALAALVVNLVIVARCVSGRDPERVPSPTAVRLVWAVVTGTVAAIVAGTLVTGSGPHAGDETAPRLDFDIPSITRVHGVDRRLHDRRRARRSQCASALAPSIAGRCSTP